MPTFLMVGKITRHDPNQFAEHAYPPSYNVSRSKVETEHEHYQTALEVGIEQEVTVSRDSVSFDLRPVPCEVLCGLNEDTLRRGSVNENITTIATRSRIWADHDLLLICTRTSLPLPFPSLPLCHKLPLTWISLLRCPGLPLRRRPFSCHAALFAEFELGTSIILGVVRLSQVSLSSIAVFPSLIQVYNKQAYCHSPPRSYHLRGVQWPVLLPQRFYPRRM